MADDESLAQFIQVCEALEIFSEYVELIDYMLDEPIMISLARHRGTTTVVESQQPSTYGYDCL